jgi:hypothetical protein
VRKVTFDLLPQQLKSIRACPAAALKESGSLDFPVIPKPVAREISQEAR